MTIDKLKNLGFSIGVELPLDNDWSRDGQQKRIKEGGNKMSREKGKTLSIATS